MPRPTNHSAWGDRVTAGLRRESRTAQLAEKGTFDALLLADFPALSDHPEYRPFQSLEPAITLATVAAHTTYIGLIATASSSYNEPYNIARRFATLDHASDGRPASMS